MPIQLEDFARCVSLSGLAASPAGSHLAYYTHHADFDSNGYLVALVVRSIASGEETVLAQAAHAPLFFWQPNGTLLFEKARSETSLQTAVWAPEAGCTDGALLPFAPAQLQPAAGGLFAVVPCARPQQPLPAILAGRDDVAGSCEIIDEVPFFSDGAGYISGKRDALYFVPHAGKPVRLTDESLSVQQLRVAGGTAWFTAHKPEDGMEAGGLYACAGQGPVQQCLPAGAYRIFGFCPGDAGVYVVAQKRDETCMTDNPGFYHWANGEMKRLPHPELSYGSTISSDCIHGAETPLQVRDGKLLFISTGEFSSFVSELAADGSHRTLTADNGSVDSFCFAGDALYFVGLRGLQGQELYSAMGDGGESCLSAYNANAFPKGALSQPERFTFASAGDGYPVNYVVLPPAGYNPAQKYPAVLYIHGGAKVNYSTVFFHEMQLLAGRGYFVVYGNPHGSDGQDSRFARLKGHYGEMDYADMMQAMDVALQRYPAIDPARLAVAGGSYGGIMVNWIIGHTGRFACAVSQRSLCNMVSSFGTADNGSNFVSEQMEGTPWDGVENLWRQSPLKYANNVTTPLLLIHSEQDFRCHFSEALQMYTAVRHQGVDARLCLVRGESHGLSRTGRPVQRVLRLNEICNWLDKYLKAETVHEN